MSSRYTQLVDSNYLYTGSDSKIFAMIDNYIYLYHTQTLIAIPTFPDQIADSTGVSYSSSTPLARSAPIFSYSGSGPRMFSVSLNLHRDLMNQINTASSNLEVPDLADEDYVDILIKQVQAMALPRYGAAEKMVDPPVIAVRFGDDIFCKGVVSGGVAVNYSGPILRNNKYAIVSVDFTINEIDPYDADSVMRIGSYRNGG